MGAGLEAGDKAPAQGPGPLTPILSLAVPHPTPFIQNDQAGPLGTGLLLGQPFHDFRKNKSTLHLLGSLSVHWGI